MFFFGQYILITRLFMFNPKNPKNYMAAKPNNFLEAVRRIEENYSNCTQNLPGSTE